MSFHHSWTPPPLSTSCFLQISAQPPSSGALGLPCDCGISEMAPQAVSSTQVSAQSLPGARQCTDPDEKEWSFLTPAIAGPREASARGEVERPVLTDDVQQVLRDLLARTAERQI
ncbi:hypothetical protein MDA_GLEAN10023166 [Myotis davidii]|uniref:Uncharacterized protein n=1 Tax=Myotis davidii TaxID=225400 RepID=L5LFC9_MYODS|nr:hypothetical protein MDA_GLEAN10023166 [Myotis davidii]